MGNLVGKNTPILGNRIRNWCLAERVISVTVGRNSSDRHLAMIHVTRTLSIMIAAFQGDFSLFSEITSYCWQICFVELSAALHTSITSSSCFVICWWMFWGMIGGTNITLRIFFWNEGGEGGEWSVKWGILPQISSCTWNKIWIEIQDILLSLQWETRPFYGISLENLAPYTVLLEEIR